MSSVTDSVDASAGSGRVLDQAAFRRNQLRHFWLLTAGPALVGIPTLAFVRPTSIDLALLSLFWMLTAVGVTCGLHRLFSHRSFKPKEPLRDVLAVLASMAGEGPPIAWAVFHRRHHELSDRSGDPHSPHGHGPGAMGLARGLLHSAFTWMHSHEVPNPVIYAPDLLADKRLVAINQRYYWWVALGAAAPAAIGGLATLSWTGALTGFLWGWAVRALLLNGMIGFVNGFNHVWGSRAFATRDHSRNMPWLALPTLGECWHNNHHAFPNSADMSLGQHRFDLGYQLIRLWRALGLVGDITVPSPQRVERRRTLDRQIPDDTLLGR
ncbi:MAG TPA: acyl-CoA desaturase [Allosphingosinicella sp.]|nr:acyl-CoA desaturase [Allosphingosinicella sp.]